MFGCATGETSELMPLSHVLSTKLGVCPTEVYKNDTCPWLRPGGKNQVTVKYHNNGGAIIPICVHTAPTYAFLHGHLWGHVSFPISSFLILKIIFQVPFFK